MLERMRRECATLRETLASMKEMTGAEGEPAFSRHMLRLAQDSLDAAERYAAASRSRRKAAEA